MGKRVIVLLLAVAAVLVSCSKDSDTLNNKMSAKINGKAWNSAIRVSNLTNNVFVITGTSTSGEVLAITIIGSEPDLYVFNTSNQQCNATYKKSVTGTTDVFTSISGKVNLTKVDMINKKISGTFDFTLVGLSISTVSVSNGTFNDLDFSITNL